MAHLRAATFAPSFPEDAFERVRAQIQVDLRQRGRQWTEDIARRPHSTPLAFGDILASKREGTAIRRA